MEICITTTVTSMRHVANGVSNNVYNLSNYLAENHDVDIKIYAPRYKGMKKVEEYPNIRIERFDIIKFSDLGIFSFDAFRKLRKTRPDLIHSFHYGYFPATAGFITAKIKQVPHVFSTSFHPTQMSIKKALFMNIYNKAHGRFILNGSTVIPQNNDEKEHLRRIARSEYKIIPDPIDNKIFYPKKSNENIILYVGTMLPWKGAHIAFDICRQNKNFRFVFIGTGPLLKDLKRRASNRFSFLSKISIEKLAYWYRKADVFLYPTKHESFGRVLAEAMMCGTPVVSTRVGAVPETVGKGGILVDYGDWHAMKEKVLYLIDNPSEKKRLAKKAIEKTNEYKLGKVCEEFYRVYKNVLK